MRRQLLIDAKYLFQQKSPGRDQNCRYDETDAGSLAEQGKTSRGRIDCASVRYSQ
jgi:hypothetical protein